MKTINVTIAMPKELLEKLKEQAAKEYTGHTTLIRQIVAKYFDEKEKEE